MIQLLKCVQLETDYCRHVFPTSAHCDWSAGAVGVANWRRTTIADDSIHGEQLAPSIMTPCRAICPGVGVEWMEAEKAGNLSDRKLGRKLRDQLTMGWTDARHRLSTVGCRAFTVHGPMVWNALPDDLRAQQDYESFRHGLKTWLFSGY